MKNKLFIPLFVLTMVFGLVACKSDIDVLGTSKNVANATLIGTDSIRSGGIVSGLDFKVVEYQFLPEKKAVRKSMTFGNGMYEPLDSMTLTYSMEYAENNVGLNITFTPDDATLPPFDVYFNENVMIENGTDTLYDKVAKLANLQKIMTDLPNTTWCYKDSSLWIDTTKVDTIKMTITSSRQPGPNGRPIIVKDTTYDTLQYELYDTIGIKMYNNVELTLNRDDNNNNMGHYVYEYYETTKDLAKIEKVSVSKDYDIHWGLYSITTARRFGVRVVSADANKVQDDFAISLYSKSAGTMKVGGDKEYTLKK